MHPHRAKVSSYRSLPKSFHLTGWNIIDAGAFPRASFAYNRDMFATFIQTQVLSTITNKHSTSENAIPPRFTCIKCRRYSDVMFGFLMGLVVVLASCCRGQLVLEDIGVEPLETAPVTLNCHRKLYTYQVTKTDSNGKQCWDRLRVWACWGRCDSNEISDWRFPFKKSSHPVCVHYGRNRAVAMLRHCEEGALPMTSRYEYLEADGCSCQQCSSSDTSCEGLRYRTHRSHPDGFLMH